MFGYSLLCAPQSRQTCKPSSRSSKKTNSCSYWPARLRSKAVLSSLASLFPFFLDFFCSASSLKKMMDYPAWHSRSEGFVFRDYDGSRLSPLAVWIRGKKIVLFRRTEKDQPSRISTQVTYETRASQGDHPLDRPAELFSAPPLTRLSPIFRGSTRPFVAKPPRRKPPLARCSFPAARANIWFRRPGC